LDDVPGGRAANGYPANAGARGIPRRPLCTRAALPRWKKKGHYQHSKKEVVKTGEDTSLGILRHSLI